MNTEKHKTTHATKQISRLHVNISVQTPMLTGKKDFSLGGSRSRQDLMVSTGVHVFMQNILCAPYHTKGDPLSF